MAKCMELPKPASSPHGRVDLERNCKGGGGEITNSDGEKTTKTE